MRLLSGGTEVANHGRGPGETVFGNEGRSAAQN